MIVIENDVFNIANRIRDIDIDYFIVYNASKDNYEIHNQSQIGSTYCVTIPYNTLDERTINFVYKTQSKNIEEILCEIEKENKLHENAEKSRVFLQLNESAKDVLKYNT